MEPSAGVLVAMPMPPIHNSTAWLVAPVVPVVTAVPLPVLFPGRSNEAGTNKPLYSATIAADRSEACVIVMAVEPLEAPGPYQISVVVPLALVACETRDQATPPPLMPETRLAVVPRVEITATSVLPFVGAAARLTPIEVPTFAPVLPLALWTRTGVR